MGSIPDLWYDEKVQDGIATAEQSAAMKSYINGTLDTASAAARITADADRVARLDAASSSAYYSSPFSDDAEDVVEELCKLWAFLLDFAQEWPFTHPRLVALLIHIQNLPQVDRTGRASIGRTRRGSQGHMESQLWEDLPKFWNLLSDYWHSALPVRQMRTGPGKGCAPSSEWINLNEFAALAFSNGAFARMELLGDWGCYILDQAANKSSPFLEVDLQTSTRWLELAGSELREYYAELPAGSLSTHSWATLLSRLREIASEPGSREEVRKKAAHVTQLMKCL
ncbi:hypothetical protein BX600DRAFT_443851 [Xylariales sp. PMI_506]|nr:hypothetical protein BX600DRAFT_443851 [Xylariales sp. PMI_506]